ncbi:MAG: DUF6036 family nucleotidyltransferase [Vicinamibacterales bacterium]|nr:DUF6036 family nucleotidyltransferase [Vicinamibacterales bacterium]
MPSEEIGKPWRFFLAEIDAAIPAPVALYCLEGFAIMLTYGLPRPTADIDLCEVAPSDAKAPLLAQAGEGSPLHKKYRVYLQMVTVASLPYQYEERATEVFAGSFARLRLMVLEPHDLALTKLGRNSDVDLEDIKYLGVAIPLDLELLRARYAKEVRPYVVGPPERSDLTLQLWCDAIRELRQ